MAFSPGDKAELSSLLDSLESLIRTTDRAVGGVTSQAAVVAWHVGVASPGFLGLLWNAQAMADNTHLARWAFAALVIASECSFLAGIIVSVWLYGQLNEMADRMAQGNADISLGIQVLRLKMAVGDRTPDAVRTMNDAKDSYIRMTKEVQAYRDRMVGFGNAASHIHNYAPLAGYALIGVLVLGQWF